MKGTSAVVAAPESLLRRLTSPDPRVPLLISGLSAAAVLSGNGVFSLIRETRGAELDWGGVYGQGVRLTGPWWLGIETPGGPLWNLPETMQELCCYRTHLTSRHRMGQFSVNHEIVVLPELPGIGRTVTVTSAAPERASLLIRTAFHPELAPVLIEGIKPYRYRVESSGTAVRVTAFGSSLEFQSSIPPRRAFLDQAGWDGRAREGELLTLGFETPVDIGPGSSQRIDWVLWGGLDTSVRAFPLRSGELLQSAATWVVSAEAFRRDWIEQIPVLRLPQSPELEEGYRLACEALRSLYFAPSPDIVGLVAGYPWYAALWCRDLAWMLPAVLWLGDHRWAEAALRSVFRFQAAARLPILGAEPGELPMQIAPGPILLYGTSDTTLYYPDLVRRLVAHSGRVEALRDLAPSLERLERWARAKLEPATGLVRNGGEAAQMSEMAQEHGRVHYGFDAVDTTIWDSTDRRDHAIDVQVLWAQTLEALADLASLAGRPEDGARLARECAAVRQQVAERYWWPEEQYLFDSLRVDGTPVRRLRPNALRAVSSGILLPERAAKVVVRASRNDLATSWGFRTLSTNDPGFDPIAYHDGQVWPIATAWAASAAYAVGDSARGLGWLRLLADRIREEGGMANECYRGDRPEPFNSCFLLGFSVAPFLTALFEDLWGLRAALGAPALSVRPRFPSDWNEASLEGLRVGSGRLDLFWKPAELTANWHGSSSVNIRGPEGSLRLANGEHGTLELD